MKEENSGMPDPNEAHFRELRAASHLISNGHLEAASQIICSFEWESLTTGIKIYIEYLKARLSLAEYFQTGDFSALEKADASMGQLTMIAKAHYCKLRDPNYLFTRALCKMLIAQHLFRQGARAMQAQSRAIYLAGIGQLKYPEMHCFSWILEELNGDGNTLPLVMLS